MALQGEAKKLYHRNTCAANGQGCLRGGSLSRRMRPAPKSRADRDQLGKRLSPLRVLL